MKDFDTATTILVRSQIAPAQDTPAPSFMDGYVKALHAARDFRLKRKFTTVAGHSVPPQQQGATLNSMYICDDLIRGMDVTRSIAGLHKVLSYNHAYMTHAGFSDMCDINDIEKCITFNCDYGASVGNRLLKATVKNFKTLGPGAINNFRDIRLDMRTLEKETFRADIVIPETKDEYDISMAHLHTIASDHFKQTMLAVTASLYTHLAYQTAAYGTGDLPLVHIPNDGHFISRDKFCAGRLASHTNALKEYEHMDAMTEVRIRTLARPVLSYSS